jgi:hypothetical protein
MRMSGRKYGTNHAEQNLKKLWRRKESDFGWEYYLMGVDREVVMAEGQSRQV